MSFLLCFGLGYSAWPFVRQAQARGWRVLGTCRDPQRAAFLSRCGIETAVFHDECLLDPALVRTATHCLVSIPPTKEGDTVLASHGDDLKAAGLSWLGYLSTTGVYGDYQGEWVNEESLCLPTQEHSRRRLMAERGWQADGLAAHVFRLAGIYGPGRSILETLRAGQARRIVKPGQVFSRIHVADIASVLMASMIRPRPGTVYNVCDDEPCPPQNVVEYGCKLLDLPLPPEIPFEEAVLSPMARSFYEDNKRVSNRRIKDELEIRLRYPTYREGLTEILNNPSLSDDYFPAALLKK